MKLIITLLMITALSCVYGRKLKEEVDYNKLMDQTINDFLDEFKRIASSIEKGLDGFNFEEVENLLNKTKSELRLFKNKPTFKKLSKLRRAKEALVIILKTLSATITGEWAVQYEADWEKIERENKSEKVDFYDDEPNMFKSMLNYQKKRHQIIIDEIKALALKKLGKKVSSVIINKQVDYIPEEIENKLENIVKYSRKHWRDYYLGDILPYLLEIDENPNIKTKCLDYDDRAIPRGYKIENALKIIKKFNRHELDEGEEDLTNDKAKKLIYCVYKYSLGDYKYISSDDKEEYQKFLKLFILKTKKITSYDDLNSIIRELGDHLDPKMFSG